MKKLQLSKSRQIQPPFLVSRAFPQRFLSFPVICTSAILEELWSCFGVSMASSSERGAAARAAPPPAEVAAFYALVEKRVTASVLCRDSRCMELSERAARHAQRLWGENSLMVAHLRMSEANVLRNLALTSTSFSEKEALCRRAWAILVPVHVLLLRRFADDTLMPGTTTEEEVTYYARLLAFTFKAKEELVPPEAVLQGLGAALGYTTLLSAVFHTLNLLVELQGFALQRESAHSFVLKALDAIPRTATMEAGPTSEEDLWR